MTSPLELELATIVEARDDADGVDAPLLQLAAQALRRATDEHDELAEHLESMSRRAVVSQAQVQRLRDRGMLEATAQQPIADMGEPLDLCPVCRQPFAVT